MEMKSNDEPIERPDVRIVAPTDAQLDAVHDALGDDTIYKLAVAARRCDVMISVTVSPYESTAEEN